MNLSRRLVAAFCLFVGASGLLAQGFERTPLHAFRKFGKADWRTLPASSVTALAQDSNGQLWVGTFDGVAIYDGRSIVQLPEVDGAPRRGPIIAIVPRRAGGVYVASHTGVHRFDRRNWVREPTARVPVSIAESPSGELWLADAEGKLWRSATPGWKQFETPKPILAISFGPEGVLWAATPDGALRIKENQIDAVKGEPLPARPGAILASRDGRVWIGTQAGTLYWSDAAANGWQRAELPASYQNAFRCLAEDRRGRIWGGSHKGTVIFGDAKGPWTIWTDANAPPIEAGVLAILSDDQGRIWFGVNGLGMAQWIGEEWSHRRFTKPLSPSLLASSAFAISRGQAPGSMLVGTFNTGFRELRDTEMLDFSQRQGITQDVRAAVQPDAHTYYVAARFGVFESHDDGAHFTQTLTLAEGFVMGLFRSPDGRWYAGSSTQGLFVRDTNGWRKEEAISAALESPHVRNMMWRANGELWVATLRGITVFRDGAAPEQISNRTDPAIPESVNAMLEVGGEEIWIAGIGGIAVRRGGHWTRFRATDGLPGESQYSLARGPDGAIWAGGSSGVGRYLDGRWKVWDTRSGLLHDECNLGGLLVDDNGEVWVGTIESLARFDPRVNAIARTPIRMLWRDAPAMDGDVPAQIPKGERALHVRWAAPWLGPEGVQYRVRVPRLRDEWSAPSADDRLDVENLAPGIWRVEVQARVEGTTDWSAPLTLDVAVPPLWYETWPARAGMVLLALAVAFALFWMRVRALRRHAAQLEATVQQRTAELAEKVVLLQESEQRALAASRAKSVFLANMSHELRTPLNGVLGFAQILTRRRSLPAEDREGLAVITKSGEHLLGLINDVLSLSKIEAGRVTLETAPFDLRGMIHDLRDLMRFRAEEKNLALVFDLDDGVPPPAVVGDEGRLRQILLNVLGNALKFTDEGSVIFRARWDEGRASFEVDDTGPGIAPHEMARVFEPFVQSESGQRIKEGTGLGLALSRDLARLMGGDITVESTAGKGSRFRVEVDLPQTDGPLEHRDRRRVVSLAPGETARRILVVDDLEINRVVLSRMLTPAGFEVREASNGAEAMALWLDWRPHMIWMDKRMHGIDGLEATRRIRESERRQGRPRTPIIALSASALEHERGEILEAGCDDFVAKPYRESTIFEKIRTSLGVTYVYEESETSTPRHPLLPIKLEAKREKSVLVVDDEWICRAVASEALLSRGIGVTTAASGREALALLEKSPFDLILMDLQMPELSGVETAKLIRANPAIAHVPVIAMSGDSFAGERARLAEMGMNDAVDKPVEPDALALVVERWLLR